MHRFLRENSQMVSATLVAGYFGCFFYQRLGKDYLTRKHFEYKNRKNIYEGLTQEEIESSKKFLFRVGDYENKIELFRSNTLEFVTLGYYKTHLGAAIGVPHTYLSNNKEEILSNEPPTGYNTLLGCFFKLKDITEKSGREYLEIFLDNSVLSKEAKSFAFSKSLSESDQTIRDNLDIYIDSVVFMLSYWFVYARNRMNKNMLKDRKIMYFGVASIAIAVCIFARFFIYKSYDRLIDEKACALGLDCCEGSLEYYDKLINRNKILRDVIPDGQKIFDQDGNYLKYVIKIPFTNYFIKINFMGEKLTERRKNCKKILLETVLRLSKEAEAKSLLETRNHEQKNIKSSNFIKDIFSKFSNSQK